MAQQNNSYKSTETLASFWKKLKIGTKVRVTYKDTYRNEEGVSTGNVVLVQTNSVARDGFNWSKTIKFTKDFPGWFYKPEASECVITENKIVIENKRCSTIVTYEILEAVN